MNPDNSSIRLGDRMIAYRHTAQPPSDRSPAIVLVHGAGCSSLDWPQTWLDKHDGDLGGYAVYALDLPGHGASGGAPIADIPAMGALVSAFVEGLGLGNVCLVGHSMGSAIAIASALEKPSNISRLVLIAGAGRFDVQQGLLDGLNSNFEATAEKVAEASWLGASNPSLKDKTVKAMHEAGQKTLLNDFSACRTVNLMDDLSKITVPVLAIAARQDRMVKLGTIEDMSAQIDHCQLAIHEDASHFLHLEKPAEVAKAISDFVGNPDAAKEVRP